jgi:hypothetical protein
MPWSAPSHSASSGSIAFDPAGAAGRVLRAVPLRHEEVARCPGLLST